MITKSRTALAFAAAAAAGAIATETGVAQAQQTQKVPKPFAVKGGLRFPTNGVLKSEIGDTWFYGGVSYDFAQTRAAKPVVYQIYGDLTFRKPGTAGHATLASGFTDDDLTGRLVGIGTAAKFLLAPARAGAQPYMGIGAGYYRATVPAFGTVYGFTGNPVGTGIVGNRTESRFGGKIFAGYQIKGGFFGEADYTYVAKIDRQMPGGFGLRVGYRF